MSDDEMMARFFASYVSPSERPTPRIVITADATRVTTAINAALNSLCEPVLPGDWRWVPESDVEYAYAKHTGSDASVWYSTFQEAINTSACTVGQFPEVERYVLWKNGVAQ